MEHRKSDAPFVFVCNVCATVCVQRVCNVCATATFSYIFIHSKLPILRDFLELASLSCFFYRNCPMLLFAHSIAFCVQRVRNHYAFKQICAIYCCFCIFLYNSSIILFQTIFKKQFSRCTICIQSMVSLVVLKCIFTICIKFLFKQLRIISIAI